MFQSSRQVRIARADVAAFARATGFPDDSDDVPPTFPIRLAAADEETRQWLAAHAASNESILVHARQSITYEGILPRDGEVTVVSAVTGGERQPGSIGRLSLRVEIRGNGQQPLVHLTSTILMVTAMPASDAARRPLRRLGTPLTPATFRKEELQAYSLISGDNNPIHLDAGVAARFGMRAPPVHGMLLFGAAASAYARLHPRRKVKSLDCLFVSPVFEGDTVGLGMEGGLEDRSRFEVVHADETLAATGTVVAGDQ